MFWLVPLPLRFVLSSHLVVHSVCSLAGIPLFALLCLASLCCLADKFNTSTPPLKGQRAQHVQTGIHQTQLGHGCLIKWASANWNVLYLLYVYISLSLSLSLSPVKLYNKKFNINEMLLHRILRLPKVSVSVPSCMTVEFAYCVDMSQIECISLCSFCALSHEQSQRGAVGEWLSPQSMCKAALSFVELQHDWRSEKGPWRIRIDEPSRASKERAMVRFLATAGLLKTSVLVGIYSCRPHCFCTLLVCLNILGEFWALVL